jgi:hypothetical protein
MIILIALVILCTPCVLMKLLSAQQPALLAQPAVQAARGAGGRCRDRQWQPERAGVEPAGCNHAAE